MSDRRYVYFPESKSGPPTFELGLEKIALFAPRPDLNGLRMKSPTSPEYFLIDRGYKRLIPDVQTFGYLFAEGTKIVEDSVVNLLPSLSPLPHNSVILKDLNSDSVFLIDVDGKRAIASMAIFDKYNFSDKYVCRVPSSIFAVIRDGVPLVD